MTRAAAVLALVLTAGAAAAAGQVPIRVTASGSYESYDFDAGLAFSKIAEFAVPIGIVVPFGRVGDLTVSTGLADVRLTSSDTAALADQIVSGMLDTEFRLSWNAVRERVVVFGTAVAPTGIETVQAEELAILGVLASDIIGFQAPTLGTGGSAGGGFGAALPVGGSWSVGVGGSVRVPFKYLPVLGTTAKIKPGVDFRGRIGAEGPLARRTYVRVAGIFAHQTNNTYADTAETGVGNRLVGYVSLNQGIGNGSLSLYGYDVYRAKAQLAPTAVGLAALPRGNLLGAGAQYEFRIGQKVRATPRAEYRYSWQAPDDTTGTLSKAGDSWRFELGLRYIVSRVFDVVLQGGGATGSLVQDAESIGFSGWRGALHLELKP
jgi:hypothetical protein